MGHHMSRKEHFWLLVFASITQAVIAVGLCMANVATACVWGVWFGVSAFACLWFAFRPNSIWAMKVSAVGIVCGTVGRSSWLLITISDETQSRGLVVARASLYLLVGILSFLVWVRLLAPNNGVARAEDQSVRA